MNRITADYSKIQLNPATRTQPSQNSRQANEMIEGRPKQSIPSISLPKGGGAIRGIGEKFAANPVTGTGSMTVPIYASPGRSGFGPQLSLSYDSGSGNGPFGFGWSLSLPSIARKTDKGLPHYQDAEESDVYILSGAEDLVPVLEDDGERKEKVQEVDGIKYRVHFYRPRIEGLFARIERWTNMETGEIHWRSITRDNSTTLYGKNNNSRIFDPEDKDPAHPTRIYSWLICESYDDKGNDIIYEYEEENSAGVDLSRIHEKNRAPVSRSANRYLKKIKYGNRISRLVQPDPSLTNWLFKVVFDYDEGHYIEQPLDPILAEDEQHRFVHASSSHVHSWNIRPDPFSSYRAGFEIRTYRRCKRVLMFHRFDELGNDPYLIRSTEFDYADIDYERPVTIETELAHKGSTQFASFIVAATQAGFVRDDSQAVVENNGVRYFTYYKKSMPPLEFEYSKATVHEDVREIDSESLENLPYGLDGSTYQWVDLDGEGISGILTEQANGWFYKRNLSPIHKIRENGVERIKPHFSPLELVAKKPAVSMTGSSARFMDLAGDGQQDFVLLDDPTPGFYERTDDEDWETFKPFELLPNISWDDPNMRFVDLNGDGHADVLITEHKVFTWHPSLAEQGFGPAKCVHKPLNEEQGPHLVFADGTQSIYLADMSGDGLTDLVRIRNGQVCYWPNLGYSHFGKKVTMDNSPWFDNPDQFDQRRIRLADIDGSGHNDIIYLGREKVHLYFNKAGNSWSAPRELNRFPHVDNLSSVMTIDLFGNGTACLVWSSRLPGHTGRQMRYLDLMGGQKPHLLTSVANNLGAETHVHYAPSTRFYLEDKKAGKPWITRLPFPVHVVERVVTYDRISRNRFLTRYAYHHGYFDGVEREFRGFGMVEQCDTEVYAALDAGGLLDDTTNLDQSSHVPPTLTRTWFHSGAFIKGGKISRQFEHEYYREGDPSLGEAGLTDEQLRAMLLEDTVLPPGLSADEAREACRVLKGSILRQEVYGIDGAEAEDRPYLVSERNYTLKLLQLRHKNKHAVFFSHPCETIDFHYERKLYDVGGRLLADPRVNHTMTLEVDEYGNVQQSVAIGYGRRRDDADPLLTASDQNKQRQIQITYIQNEYTNAIIEDDAYRTPLLCETRTYELVRISPDSGLVDVTNLFRFEEMLNKVHAAGDGSHDLPYEDVDAQGAIENHAYRRLIEHFRTYFCSDNLAGRLSHGQLQSLALPYESYKLAFTPGLIAKAYNGRVTDAMLEQDGRYVHTEGDANWWIPSGRIFYSPHSIDTVVQELDYAREHFFLPLRYHDPFHTDFFNSETLVSYDKYDLLIQETRDALGNILTAGERDTAGNLAIQGNDYRVLQPAIVMNPNRNRSVVAFDALGMVVGSAVMGKPEENLGDSLADFEPNLTDAVIADHLQNPLADPHSILQNATTRMLYDLFAFIRSKHLSEPQPAVVYSIAREIHESDLPAGQQSNEQHSFSYSDGFSREIQKKIQAEPERINGVTGPPRWVGRGWTIFNNKGNPVRQYEPFFSDNHLFEFAKIVGVSPILFYDPVERVVATLHPNHTLEKVVFDPWKQETWDVNDTALIDPRLDEDVRGFFLNADGTFRLHEIEYLPTWYALRTDPAFAEKAATKWPDAKVLSAEQSAAAKTAEHANTPTTACFDTLGRTFLTAAYNGFDAATGDPIKYATRLVLDIEGNQREVIDALDRIVMRYDYDMLGAQVHQASMEAGERWTLNDVAGRPAYGWDSRAHRFRTTYDQLRRPTGFCLQEGSDPELLVGRTIYGEAKPDPESKNLRGQVIRIFDQAGVIANDEYDFKGNLLASQRRLARNYKTTVNWAVDVPLETEIFISRTSYDALNRPIEITLPDNSAIQPGYNQANLLERIDANLRGASHATPFVTNIDYDAKGQRTEIDYATRDDRGISTMYEYDSETFRLMHLKTTRHAPRFDSTDRPGEVQNLYYCYDPVGNITHIRDEAQQTIYFRNRRVEPSNDYIYDAIYRLTEATGREHLGQTGGYPNPPTPPDAFNQFHTRLDHPGDGNAMGAYIEKYEYDAVGNFLKMIHRGSDPAHPGWTRTYAYNENSQLESGKKNNRLSNTTISVITEKYRYEGSAGLHGNMTQMPHLPLMQWDYRDQLQATSKQVVNNGGIPEITYYVYDVGGQRVRKVTERQAEDGEEPTRLKERIYLGGFEIYREYNGGSAEVKLERETLHIMDDKQRIAIVETRTIGNDHALQQLVRYQISNHLGSASLEMDEQARIISYEEYTPYSSTSYHGVRSQTETLKRYRCTGKERDEESGLYYHGARYYAPWVGRWISYDPAWLTDGNNGYIYARNGPIKTSDPTGMWGESMTLDEGRVWDKMTVAERVRFREFLVEREYKSKYLSERQKGIPESTRDIPYFEGAEPDILDRLETVYNHGSTADKVEMIATGVGTAGGLLPYVGDYISLAGSVVTFVAKPSWENAGDVALDVFGAFLPLLPAMGTIRRNERIAKIASTTTSATDLEKGVKSELKMARALTDSELHVQIAERLEDLKSSALDKLNSALLKGDVAYLRGRDLPESWIKSVVEGNSQYRMNYGNILERMLAQDIQLDPLLRQYVDYTSNIATYGLNRKPDFWIKTGTSTIPVDLTTSRQRARHYNRVENSLVLTYPGAP
ncbi:toxin [candidate division KSB1 bacterium]|nr:toxin [candidate division KSB1 bacterium]